MVDIVNFFEIVRKALLLIYFTYFWGHSDSAQGLVTPGRAWGSYRVPEIEPGWASAVPAPHLLYSLQPPALFLEWFL